MASQQLSLHFLHGSLPPRNTSRARRGTISLQNGQNTMTASQSSVHVQRLARWDMQAQHRDWEQQLVVVMLLPHRSASQNSSRHTKHV